MSDATMVLRAATKILIVDWPSRDVPDTLAKSGYAVYVKGGPEPDSYSVYEAHDGVVTVRKLGYAPDAVDLVYAHRPLGELSAIVALATGLDATTVWLQSGITSDGRADPAGCFVPPDVSLEARRVVEAAGLRYLDDVYIADVARACGPQQTVQPRP